MSGWSIAILAAAYLLPALLAVGIALRSAWSRTVRGGALVIAAALFLVTWLCMPQLLGWPTAEPLPAKFRLVSAEVQQPDKATRDPGAVYLWVTDAADLASSPPPRAYRLPYSGTLHEAVTGAMAKLANGMPQLGEFSGTGQRSAMPESATPSTAAAVPLKFYDMSDPLFPDK